MYHNFELLRLNPCTFSFFFPTQHFAPLGAYITRLHKVVGSSWPLLSNLVSKLRMDPQLPESFNHRTEKLATGRVYHFVRCILLLSNLYLSKYLHRLTNSQTTTIQNGTLLYFVYMASLIFGDSYIPSS